MPFARSVADAASRLCCCWLCFVPAAAAYLCATPERLAALAGGPDPDPDPEAPVPRRRRRRRVELVVAR